MKDVQGELAKAIREFFNDKDVSKFYNKGLIEELKEFKWKSKPIGKGGLNSPRTELEIMEGGKRYDILSRKSIEEGQEEIVIDMKDNKSIGTRGKELKISFDNAESRPSEFLSLITEYHKCQNDIVYFVQKYWRINGEKVVLTSAQKELLCLYERQT